MLQGCPTFPPFHIEDNIKNELPNLLSNVFLMGDRRKFLTCLMTLRVEFDPASETPTNRLTEEAVAFCRSVGSAAATVDDVTGGSGDGVLQAESGDGVVQAEIKKALQRANEVQCSVTGSPPHSTRQSNISVWTDSVHMSLSYSISVCPSPVGSCLLPKFLQAPLFELMWF